MHCKLIAVRVAEESEGGFTAHLAGTMSSPERPSSQIILLETASYTDAVSEM